MKFRFRFLVYGLLAFTAASCGSAGDSGAKSASAENTRYADQAAQPLINQIRRLPGVSLFGGVPVFTKGVNSIQGGARNEPLYVLDGMIMGNSFREVERIVIPSEVESLQALTGSDAAFYGSRGSNGVIIIKSRSGN